MMYLGEPKLSVTLIPSTKSQNNFSISFCIIGKNKVCDKLNIFSLEINTFIHFEAEILFLEIKANLML